MNKHQVIGNLGKDPELRRLPESNRPVCTISIASNEYYKSEKHTEWHKAVFFDAAAELIAERVLTGNKIYVAGPVRKKTYQDKDGNERLSVEIIVQEFEFLDRIPVMPGGIPDPDWQDPNLQAASA